MSNQTRSRYEDFDSYEQVGSGTFGVVYKCRRKIDNRIYALKTVQLKSQQEFEATVKEIHILAGLKHKHIIKYYDCFPCGGNTKLNIVMEYAGKGTLHDLIRSRQQLIPEAEVWKYFCHILTALNYVHSNNILHRDMKPMNVFLDDRYDCKLGDFGVSKVLDQPLDLAATLIGTPLYMSPELCKNIPYDARSDVWALGCILYELCALSHPFEHAILEYQKNQLALMQAVTSGKWDRDVIKRNYSKNLLQVIE
ncbi:serine/threonine-protein kinase Nek, partial [Acrasis kona]